MPMELSGDQRMLAIRKIMGISNLKKRIIVMFRLRTDYKRLKYQLFKELQI